MTEQERKILEDAAFYKLLVADMIEQALLASQRLCTEIQGSSPNALETAKDVKQRLGYIWEWWKRLTGNESNFSS